METTGLSFRFTNREQTFSQWPSNETVPVYTGQNLSPALSSRTLVFRNSWGSFAIWTLAFSTLGRLDSSVVYTLDTAHSHRHFFFSQQTPRKRTERLLWRLIIILFLNDHMKISDCSTTDWKGLLSEWNGQGVTKYCRFICNSWVLKKLYSFS